MIALALAIEKTLELGALVRAGLVVHDPADSMRIDEGSIQGNVDESTLDFAGEAIFGVRITMIAAQEPTAASVAEHAAQCSQHTPQSRTQLSSRHALLP